MVRFPVSAGKAEALCERMAAQGVLERDLLERFFCPNSGRLRKRAVQVGVHLRHALSNVEVHCHKSSSQALNRFLARRMLVRLLEKRQERCSPDSPLASSGSETTAQHMHRMFAKSFEKDIAQPYPIPAQKLLGVGSLPRKLIGIMGERESVDRRSS